MFPPLAHKKTIGHISETAQLNTNQIWSECVKTNFMRIKCLSGQVFRKRISPNNCERG